MHSPDSISESIRPLELDWYAEDDVVHVTPRNEQRFRIQKDRAIQILQRANEAVRADQQFSLLLHTLATWIRSRKAKIANAIVTLQEGSLAFVIVRKEATYDEQFQDEVADLDFEVAHDSDLDLFKLKSIALPHVTGEALDSFLDPRLVLSYHGDGIGSHQPR